MSRAPYVPDLFDSVVGSVPSEAVAAGRRLYAKVSHETMLCGDTASAAGWSIESHTIGCRNAADEPREDWLDSHLRIYDEYRSDGVSFVVGDPSDGGVFVTFTPQRGARPVRRKRDAVARVRAVARPRVEHVGGRRMKVGVPLDLRSGSPSSTSFEGVGLSVSVHPEAWSSIAKLGSVAFSLERSDSEPGRFAVYGKAIAAAASLWAVREGWAVRSKGWEVTYYDEEDDVRRSFLCPSADDARAEADGLEGQEPEVEEVEVLTASPRMETRWRSYFTGADWSRPLSPYIVETEAANLWVAAVRPDLDGIWWNDRLDPASLSAPRGVILPHAAPRWVPVRRYSLRAR